MKWYVASGPDGDVVISSRIRLARNIKGYPFANALSDIQSKEVLEKCKKASQPLKLKYLSMETTPATKRQMLLECHLISPEMLNDTKNKAVLLSDDEQTSILLGEEDHIRIQCMKPGLNLSEAFSLADKTDDVLEETLDFSFNPRFGYATCCPTNTGTGLRASCMLHLPAITYTGYIDTLLATVGKLGMTVRGVYGEGTKAKGNMYQISNQITLGIDEQDSVKRLHELVKMVAEKERNMQETMEKESGNKLADTIWRSYGILKNARMLTSEEAYKLLSDMRLGVNLGILTNVPIELINELIIITGPAHIADKCTENTHQNRDKTRANIVRRK
ncbi:MAG: protein arginine kinase [Clostridiaceae bacterium]|nr:protein arginine kinase [Clostridiaceae bacterium]